MTKEKNFISVVIYFHNAQEYVTCVLEKLIDFLDLNFEHSEIVCINDFSYDGTLEQIKSLKNNLGNVSVSVVNMSYFHGLEMSMNAGVDIAIGDYVLEIDDIGSMFPLEQIMIAYNKMLDGYDIVSVSANKKQRFSSSVFYCVYKHFSDTHLKLQTESFRVLSRRAINRVSGASKTVPYRKMLYLNCGLKSTHINCTVEKSDLENKDSREIKKYRKNLAINSLIMFTNAGYVFSTVMTFLMLCISSFMIFYTVYIYACKNPVVGWTTTLLFLSVAFCGLFAILTIIIKYLQILLDLNFKRKKYSFESVEKL